MSLSVLDCSYAAPPAVSVMAAPMPVYNAAPGPDMAAQIAQLATLRDKGVLTELEFTCAAPRPATRMPVPQLRSGVYDSLSLRCASCRDAKAKIIAGS